MNKLNTRELQRQFSTPRAILDFDFVERRYSWGGVQKVPSNFATFTLNGCTFSDRGLDLTNDPDISVLLSEVGAVIPGTMLVVASLITSPASTRSIAQLDDTLANERIAIRQTTVSQFNFLIVDGAVNQVNTSSSNLSTFNIPHCGVFSYQTDLLDAIANGATVFQDTAATMPTVTHLRIGHSAAGNPALVHVQRVVLWDVVFSVSRLRELSCQFRHMYM